MIRIPITFREHSNGKNWGPNILRKSTLIEQNKVYCWINTRLFCKYNLNSLDIFQRNFIFDKQEIHLKRQDGFSSILFLFYQRETLTPMIFCSRGIISHGIFKKLFADISITSHVKEICPALEHILCCLLLTTAAWKLWKISWNFEKCLILLASSSERKRHTLLLLLTIFN